MTNLTKHKAKIGLLVGLGAILAMYTLSSELVLAAPFALQYPYQYQPNQFSPSTSAATTTTGKFLRAIMTPYSDQSTLLNIYKYPIVDIGDVVDMHTNINNLQYTKMLATSTGAGFGGSFFSLAAMQQFAPIIKSSGGSSIGYDLENQYSPASEMANPVQSMTMASNIAHSYGLKFICDPSHKLTDIYYNSFAKVSDIYNIQSETFSGSPSTFSNYVHGITAKLKAAHPGMPVIAETSTNKGTLAQLEQDFSSVADVVDGSTTWYASNSQGYTELSQYVTWFVNHYG